MAITVSNSNALSLLNILNKTQSTQSDVLRRLSTGSKINSGSDDPAGLIAMRQIDSNLRSVDTAISNNQRTDAMLGVADKAMNEIASMLSDIQDLAQKSANSAGLSVSEVAANQAQIDNAIEAIDRIVGSTQFNGKKLLDGSLAIQASTSDSAKITDVDVFSRNPESTVSTLSVEVTNSAERASHTLATTSASTATTIQVAGTLGSAVIEVAADANLSAVAVKINDATATTGITASVNGSNELQLFGDYGSSSFVKVDVLAGGGSAYTAGDTDGTDATVSVNGQAAAVDGLKVNYLNNGVNVSFTITEDFNDDGAGAPQTITVSSAEDSGATFQLGTEASTRATIGVSSLYSQRLGDSVSGYLSTLKSGSANSLLIDPSKAATIAKKAVSQLAQFQGQIGGFQKFQVKTAINSLNANKEGLSSARSTIADVDYAAETAELSRQNVLLQSSISLLGVANQQTSQILSLLR
jgi:flagellin